MTLTQLYLFTVVLPNTYQLFDFLGGLFAISAIITLMLSGAILSQEEEIAKAFFKYFIRLSICAIITALVAIPLPSEKQLYTIAGGYVATNAKDVSKLPDKVVKAANAWLEKAATLADDKAKDAKK